MGYTGGTLANPTYRNLGDHSEAIEVAYDPAKISYEELLTEFWAAHHPEDAPWGRQYRSAIFVHDEAQRQAAERTKQRTEQGLGKTVYTAIEPAGTFYQAEDYHQKYRLKRKGEAFGQLLAIYPQMDDLVRSTAATRLNAWAAGWGTDADRDRDLPKMGALATSPAAAAHRSK